MNLNTLRDMGTRLRLGIDIDGGAALHDQTDNRPQASGLVNVFQLDGMRLLTATANLKPAAGKPRLVGSGSSNSARFAEAGLALAQHAPHPCA